MRAEYSTRTEARVAIGVRTIIDDANVYDHLKLMARFVRLAGFGGMVVARSLNDEDYADRLRAAAIAAALELGEWKKRSPAKTSKRPGE